MTPESPAGPEPGLGLLELASLLLRRWRLVVLVPLAFGLAGAVVSLTLQTLYTARASFVPEVKPTSLPSGISSLAGQFGLSLPSQGSQSPFFYGDLLRSRGVMQRVLDTRFRRPGGAPADSATFLELLRVRGRDPRDVEEKALRKLQSLMTVMVDNQTNIVTLSVDAPGAQLAADVTNRFLVALDSFNQVTRRSQARSRRIFIEGQIAQAQKDLGGAEDDLRGWAMHNRTYRGYPELELEYDRLQRRVTLRQEVYTNLYRELDAARIEEVNDTPVITVVDRADPPARKSRPSRLALTVLATALGLLVVLFLILGQYYGARLTSRDAAGVAEVRAAWRGFRASLAALRRR